MVLLHFSFLTGFFSSLGKMASFLVSKVEPLLATFTSLSSYQPLLSLSFFKLIASLGCKAVRTVEIPCEVTTNQQLVAMVTKVIQIDNTVSLICLLYICIIYVLYLPTHVYNIYMDVTVCIFTYIRTYS